MRRISVLLIAVLVGLPACGGGSSSSSGAVRTILVDFNYDQFATSYLGFFPTVAAVHPGDTIDFKQAWTGEPHTVTMGTLANGLGKFMGPFVKKVRPVPAEEDPSLDAEFEAAYKGLPEFFGEGDGGDESLTPSASRPCYLPSGDVPTDKPCPTTEQPAFNGRQVFYNSGFIAYQGNNGNHFKVDLAKDTPAGEYFYFCLIHGPLMGGFLDVKPVSADTPSQGELNRQARKDLDAVTARMRKLDKAASSGKDRPAGVDVVEGGNGYEDGGIPPFLVDEFYPSTVKTTVGKKVTWRISGHTVSFKVPKYGPQIIVRADRSIEFNKQAYEAQGGPGYPKASAPSDESSGEPKPVAVDAGEYDGSKFLSSGLPDGAMDYSITFSKPGTYKYACLIHPAMIGTVVVSK